MLNEDIISMPTSGVPLVCGWDLAFHTLPLSIVDPDFAKEQMKLMLKGVYLHPSGQMPAYEWNFSDVNPRSMPGQRFPAPHRAGPARRNRPQLPQGDVQQAALELQLVGKPQGRFGKNVFDGGFLGLDNIGVFDRSAPLPRRPPGTGGRHGLDGTF